MKKLIFLSGPANCGKTTTLKMLIVKLLQAGAVIEFCTRKTPTTIQSLQNEIINAIQNKNSSTDIIIIVKLNNVKIGIRTLGDTIGSIWDNVWFFENKNCDIGVSACHPEHLKRSMPCIAAPWDCKKVIDKNKASNASAYYQENDAAAQILFDIIINTVNCIALSTTSVNQISNP